MVTDRLLGHHEPFCDLRVAQPLGDQHEHLELAVGQSSGVIARAGARASGQPPSAQLTQSSRHDRGGRTRIQRAKLFEGFAERALGAAVEQRQRCFIRTADLLPQARGASSLPGYRQRVRFRRRARRKRIPNPGAPPPHSELPNDPGHISPERQRQRVVGRVRDLGQSAFEPGRLGTGRGRRREPLRSPRCLRTVLTPRPAGARSRDHRDGPAPTRARPAPRSAHSRWIADQTATGSRSRRPAPTVPGQGPA